MKPISLFVLLALLLSGFQYAQAAPRLGASYPDIKVTDARLSPDNIEFAGSFGIDVATVCIGGFGENEEFPVLSDKEVEDLQAEAEPHTMLYTDKPYDFLEKLDAASRTRTGYVSRMFQERGILGPGQWKAFALDEFPKLGTVAVLVYHHDILVSFQICPTKDIWRTIRETNLAERVKISGYGAAREGRIVPKFDAITPFREFADCMEAAKKQGKQVVLLVGDGWRGRGVWEGYCARMSEVPGADQRTFDQYLFCVIEFKEPLTDARGKPRRAAIDEIRRLKRECLDYYRVNSNIPTATIIAPDGTRRSSCMSFAGNMEDRLKHLRLLDFCIAFGN